MLIITIGGAGDINPFIAISLALQRKGHDVVMLVNPFFERQIRDAGVGYRPLGELFDLRKIADTPELMHERKGPRVALRKFLLPAIPIILDAVEAAVHELKPDIVLSHPSAHGTRWICERLEVPWAVGVLAPITWLSRTDPGVLQSWEPDTPPLWYVRLRFRVGRWILRRLLDRPLNPIRRRYGFPPGRDLFLADVRGGVVNLGLWSRHLRGPTSDDPPTGRICGFPWFDRDQELEHPAAELDRFLSEGKPPIIFTLGTSVVHVGGNFYDHAAEACRLLGRRGLLLTRHEEYARRNLPNGVQAFSYAPFSTVLPRGCATVHHGGVGTTAQAMRAGRPTLIVPFAYDQFDHAARAKRLGVSVTVKRKQVSPRSLAAALRTVLDDPDVVRRAEQLGKKLSEEDGALNAVTALEEAVDGAR